MSQSSFTAPPKRTHRKRFSATRLSSDTTATLPEYTSPIWKRHRELPETYGDSDRPPDYPESAEEADEETDTGDEAQVVYAVPPLSPPPLASPRRIRRYPGVGARRRQTGSTSDLDTLLQRSVHALEMSNALLQSSMSTQSSLSVLLASDNVVDQSLDRSALSVSSRMIGGRHQDWMDDLEEITEGVDGLFGESADTRRTVSDGMVSQSLPISSMSSIHGHRRRPSLNPHGKAVTSDSVPHLHLSSQVDRTELVAPAPRALTLYVASTDDPESILLPSTLGLRTSASSHNSELRIAEPPPPSNMPYSALHASASMPVLTDRPSAPATPAYNLLSSFVTQQQAPPSPVHSNSSSSLPRLPFSFPRRRGSGSTTSTATEREVGSSPVKRGRRGSCSRSRSVTPHRAPTPLLLPRPMTPPIEELSASSSSSSSDHPHAYRTMQSLRKILDEQRQNIEDKKKTEVEGLKRPVFMPRSPMPIASSSTSTATASVSRLLTKATHHSSTRPPSPPKHSSLKRNSAPPTPTLLTPKTSTSNFFGAGVARVMGSAPSSGRSTPKRISFAELPESYAGSRPEGSSRFKAKQKKSRTKGKSKAKSQVDKAREENGGWWTGWLLGASGAGTASGLSSYAHRHEERMEDRAARTWGGRGGLGGMDDWGV